MGAPLILKRAPIGDNEDEYSVLEDGILERLVRGTGAS
jgi:hypothetical protein